MNADIKVQHSVTLDLRTWSARHAVLHTWLVSIVEGMLFVAMVAALLLLLVAAAAISGTI